MSNFGTLLQSGQLLVVRVLRLVEVVEHVLAVAGALLLPEHVHVLHHVLAAGAAHAAHTAGHAAHAAHRAAGLGLLVLLRLVHPQVEVDLEEVRLLLVGGQRAPVGAGRFLRVVEESVVYFMSRLLARRFTEQQSKLVFVLCVHDYILC